MPHRTRPVLLSLWLSPWLGLCLAGALGSAGCVPDGALLGRGQPPARLIGEDLLRPHRLEPVDQLDAVEAQHVRAGDCHPVPARRVEHRARQHTGDNRRLYESLLRQFTRDHLDADHRVRRLLASGERLAAVRLAHTLKGSAGTLGAVRLQFRAAALESVLCRPDKPADAALGDFAEALTEVRAGLELWQAGRGGDGEAAGPRVPQRDPAELAPQLDALIADHDTGALALAEQLVAAYAGASLEPQLRELTQAVRNYDFPRAAALLRGSGLLGSRS